LLALLLAPLHLCCVNHAADAASLAAAVDPGAQIILCAHHGEAGDHQDHAPGPQGEDHCPGCHLVNVSALVAPLATSEVAYAHGAGAVLAPPESLGFRAATAFLAARPRAPPILI
jgi:hypothetical protein